MWITITIDHLEHVTGGGSSRAPSAVDPSTCDAMDRSTEAAYNAGRIKESERLASAANVCRMGRR